MPFDYPRLTSGLKFEFECQLISVRIISLLDVYDNKDAFYYAHVNSDILIMRNIFNTHTYKEIAKYFLLLTFSNKC